MTLQTSTIDDSNSICDRGSIPKGNITLYCCTITYFKIINACIRTIICIELNYINISSLSFKKTLATCKIEILYCSTIQINCTIFSYDAASISEIFHYRS
ncbi:hypothetical protein HPMG_01470 [Helicobacter pullorum MIT 98-5489]|uniref:Uncharacterized protein n=1 Tax=Helicobacter pullorum MIT 98-5489 TaxID=537972 RepID=C5F1R9_9HELI|nr:hypothetical protein HPMG_01470 [Helicobacter pullorum MIT 98-5489]